MDAVQKFSPALGRVFLALIFILAGLGKIPAPAGSIGYMEAYGVPGILFWPSVIVEVGAGIALLVGYQARWAALALGLFSLLTAVIFHTDFADQMQLTAFLKNLAIAGGMLYVFAFGAGPFSVDNR
ncbi:DoxX family protein [Pelagibacterium limicola]|uniref:DoxX family protein n=1 Tax=Pelagibacterium limicola TaxID=2791022 RepID=UPI0018AFBB30|nr:DoxX family protein [Pelagibacterium limicola]